MKSIKENIIKEISNRFSDDHEIQVSGWTKLKSLAVAGALSVALSTRL